MTDGPSGPPAPGRPGDWSRRRVLVAGTGVAGSAVARVLSGLGAHVVAHDDRVDAAAQDRAAALRELGVTVALGPVPPLDLAGLVVTSPGIPPGAAILRAAEAVGVPVWGEAELAWRLRTDGAAPWLVVTGTNGKTTTVRMTADIVRADGRRAVAAGNVGTPLVEVVTDPDPYDVVAVELSSFQLQSSSSIAPLASVVLNLAPDHLDWHGSHDAYAAAKALAYERCQEVALVPLDEPGVRDLLDRSAPGAGCREVGLTLGIPPTGALGVVEDLLVDRAFGPDPASGAVELATVGDLFAPAPHVVADALAAAGLARAVGVSPAAVRDGLRGFRPDPHRIAHVATIDGVAYVDDSKATNSHAALASLAAYPSVVWVAGGLAKGADFDDLIRSMRSRLRAVVLLGQDRAVIRTALERHAPDVPVVEVATAEDGAMEEVVTAAAELARVGDTVLLAPACASWDMFSGYAERGDAFASAVRHLPSHRNRSGTGLDT